MKLGNLGKIAVTASYNRPAKGNIWFLHGTSDSGPGQKAWIKDLLHREFNFKDYRILYPTAPQRPYSLFDGKVSCTWYDRLALSPEMPEDDISIQKTASKLGQLIKEQSELKGIPLSKVIIGGFSLGGSMALHLAYRLRPEIAGCFVLSSCIPPDSQVYRSLDHMRRNMKKKSTVPITNVPEDGGQKTLSSAIGQQTKIPSSLQLSKSESSNTSAKASLSPAANENELKLPELFMSHGAYDPLVRHAWAKSTFSKLKDHGVKGHFYTMPQLEHSIHPLQLHLLHNWINNVLEDTPPAKIPPNSTQNSFLQSSVGSSNL